MIARVTFTLQGQPATAELGDDARWSCADSVIGGLLNTLILTADTSPAAGIPYRAHASQMAAMLKGAVEFPGQEESPPDRVY